MAINKTKTRVFSIIKDVILNESFGSTKYKEKDFLSDDQMLQVLAEDSLLALEIVSRIEKEFKIIVNEEDFIRFTSFDDITALINEKLNKPKKNRGKLAKNESKKQKARSQ